MKEIQERKRILLKFTKKNKIYKTLLKVTKNKRKCRND